MMLSLQGSSDKQDTLFELQYQIEGNNFQQDISHNYYFLVQVGFHLEGKE